MKNHPNEIKAAIENTIDEVAEKLRKEGKFQRMRKLPPETVIRLLISMRGGGLNKELYDAHVNASPAAFSMRRKLISEKDMEDILETFNDTIKNEKTYEGYQIFAVDGTSVNLPRNSESKSFVKNAGHPNGLNQLHVTPLFDVLSNIYRYCVIQPQTTQDEIGALLYMLAWYDFETPTLIIGDRGFESYEVIAAFQEKAYADYLIRVRQGKNTMREIRKLPEQELDRDLSFYVTTSQTNAAKAADHVIIPKRKERTFVPPPQFGTKPDFSEKYRIQFRAVRFLLSTGEYETLITSLSRSITLAQIKELYRARWSIETSFRTLKYSIGLTNLHGKRDEFARQEIYAAMIMSNFASKIVENIVSQKKKENAYLYAVDMKMAIHLCREFLRTKHADGDKLLQEFARYTEPVRPGRSDVRKLRAKGFVGFVYRVAA